MKQALFIVLTVFTISGDLSSTDLSDVNRVREYNGQTVWDLPSIPEQDIDIGLWALIIARECVSSVDIDKYLHTLDTMAAQIRYMVGPRDGDMVRFMMAKMYQFDTGTWNGGRVFSYDLDDPMGEKPGARLLTTYLDTRKGNCVSIPTLFLALMERVDSTVPFHGVAAPLHLFCRLHDRQDGSVWNVETTHGGNPARDQWYVEKLRITQLAIESGVYMADLTKKQFLAELVGVLVSKHRQEADYHTALKYAEVMLQLNPRSVTGMVQKGALLGWIGHMLQERIRAENRRPTADEDRDLRLYMVESENYISRARSLGWEPESPESRDQYLKAIREARMNNRHIKE